jgi:DNA-binding LytR/AlgR family response regulator
MTQPVRVPISHPDGSCSPVDPLDVYLLEAEADQARVRTRSAEVLYDVRPLGELVTRFEPHGFVRIHRSFAVQIGRIRHIRPRKGEGWEVRLDPPVNRVLPVSESHAPDLWRALGEE